MTPRPLRLANLVRWRKRAWHLARFGIRLLIPHVVAFVLALIIGFGPIVMALLAAFLIYPAILMIAPVITIWTLRKRPRTLLILRTFHEPVLAQALTKVVQTELSWFGVPLTLADTQIGSGRRSWFAPKAIRIDTRTELAELGRTLNRARSLGMRWIRSASRLITLPSSDFLWRDLVALLIANVDIVVVDASETAPGSVWELERLAADQEHLVLLFIAAEDRIDAANGLVSAFFPAESEHVFAYDQTGMFVERDRVIAYIESRFSTVHAA